MFPRLAFFETYVTLPRPVTLELGRAKGPLRDQKASWTWLGSLLTTSQ
jgi:hypothetical protein